MESRAVPLTLKPSSNPMRVAGRPYFVILFHCLPAGDQLNGQDRGMSFYAAARVALPRMETGDNARRSGPAIQYTGPKVLAVP